jgi:hypothetical protein
MKSIYRYATQYIQYTKYTIKVMSERIQELER